MKLQTIIFLFIAAFSMSACTDTITLELEDPSPVLVVDGYITNQDTTQSIRLSLLENYFAEQPPNYSIYESAKVTLKEDSVTVGTYTFNNSTEKFELQYQGIIGKNYQIDIVLPDGSSYLSAAEEMEEIVPIDTIWYELNTVDGPGNEEGDFLVLINTKEPAGEGDNYQWKSYINNEYNFEPQDIFVSDDRFVDGQDVVDLEVYNISQENYQIIKSESPTNQVVVKIEQARISTRYFQYVSLVAQQLLQVGSPFAAPPAEIRGNVYKQGENEVLALGYFYTSAVSTASIEIIE